MEKEVIILMGLSGSGKTTYAEFLKNDTSIRISQDDMGKSYLDNFYEALKEPSISRIIVDRCNLSRMQRSLFLAAAKCNGFTTTIIDLSETPSTCYKRIKNRKNHPTLDFSKDVLSVLWRQINEYEYPLEEEADNVNVSENNPYIKDVTNRMTDFIVVGDIHGCYDEFIELTVGGDSVISVGDMIDRGPKIKEILNHFMSNRDTHFSVRGNHEDKFIRYLLGNKVDTSYLEESIQQTKDINKEDLVLYLMSLPLIIKHGINFIFHGGIDFNYSIYRQQKHNLLYDRDWHSKDQLKDHIYNRRFFGHCYHDTVYLGKETYALDGNCVFGGELRGIIMPRKEIFTVKAKKAYKENNNYIHENIKPFEEQVALGYLSKQEKGDLVLYNYTDHCTYEKAWNNCTLKARGIIFNRYSGSIVANPLEKFFNLSELNSKLPEEDYECFEKVDGSLAIIYNYRGVWEVATRGSFKSPQAIKAKELLGKYDMTFFSDDMTILAEVIYPENRIVIDYESKEELVLLSIRDRKSGKEYSRSYLEWMSFNSGLRLCEKYDYTIEDMIDLQKTLPAQKEGFVVRFSSGYRVKIKGEEYLKIHRIISKITPLNFWKIMKNGKVSIDFVESIPEEYLSAAIPLIKELEGAYEKVKLEVQEEINYMVNLGYDLTDHKSVGLYIKSNILKHSSCFFPIIRDNKKAVDSYIMKYIRPVRNN